MNKYLKKRINSYFLTAIVSVLAINCCKSQTSHLIGFDYSLLSLSPSYASFGLTNSTKLHNHYSSYEINFTSLRGNSPISFRNAITYTPIQWTENEFRDFRYPYNSNASPFWLGTQTNCKTQNLGFSSYVMFTTKDKLIKGFFAIGIQINSSIHSDYETFVKNKWQHYDSISNMFVEDSTTNYLTEKRSQGYKFIDVCYGFQIGCIAKFSTNFYLSTSVRVSRFKDDRVILIERGFIYSLDFGLHYNLNSKKQSKPPPN